MYHVRWKLSVCYKKKITAYIISAINFLRSRTLSKPYSLINVVLISHNETRCRVVFSWISVMSWNLVHFKWDLMCGKTKKNSRSEILEICSLLDIGTDVLRRKLLHKLRWIERCVVMVKFPLTGSMQICPYTTNSIL